MAKYRRPGKRRGLSPFLREVIKQLHQIDIAVVMPAADEVDIAVLIGKGDTVVDGYRHIRQFGEVFTDHTKTVAIWLGNFGAIQGDRITTKQIEVLFQHSRRHGEAPVVTKTIGYIWQFLPAAVAAE